MFNESLRKDQELARRLAAKGVDTPWGVTDEMRDVTHQTNVSQGSSGVKAALVTGLLTLAGIGLGGTLAGYAITKLVRPAETVVKELPGKTTVIEKTNKIKEGVKIGPLEVEGPK